MKSLAYRLSLVLLACAVLAGAGCSNQARMERRVAKGNKLIAAGDYKSAEVEYRAALQLSPDNPKVLGRIGIMIYNQGRPLSAYYMLNGVRENLPDDWEVQLYYGLSCLSLARTSEARTVAKKVLEKHPANEEALLLLVETCLTTRDNEEAQRLIEQYRGQGDTSAHHVALGSLLLGRKEPAAAEAEFRKALALDPKSSAAYGYLGAIAQAQGKTEEARQALKQSADLAGIRSPRRIRYIDFLMQQKALGEARQELARILGPAPDYIPAWGLKMKIDFLEEKYEESDRAAAEVLARDHANYEALMQRAAIKLVKTDLEGVIGDLKKVEEIYERAPQVKYQLALAYLATGNSGRAEDYLQLALRLSPNFVDASMQLAEINLRKGDPATAIVVLSRLLEREPRLPRGYVLLAQAHRAQGNLAKAVDILRAVAAASPDRPDGPYLVGTILIEMDRKKEAREAFEQSLQRSALYWPAIEGLITLDLLEKQTAAATERIKQLLEKDPNAVPPRLMRARIRFLEGDSAGAEEDLLKAIELEPKAQYPYLLLARIYYNSDRARAALEKLKALAGRKPDQKVLVQLGMLHEALKQYEDARTSYEKALTLEPALTPALNNLAVLYNDRLGQPDKALELAKKAQTLRPNDPIVADTYAAILFRKGQYDRGLQFAQQAVEKIPGDPEIQYRFGLFHYFLGHAEQARRAFQNALGAIGDSPLKEDAARRLAVLELDPASPDPGTRERLERALREDAGDPVALVSLAQIEIRAGQSSEAAEHLEAALRINPGLVPAMLALIDLSFGPLAKPDRGRELAKLVRAAEPNDPNIAWQLGQQMLKAGEFAAAGPLLADAARAINGQPELLFDVARSQYSLGRIPEAEKALETYLGTKETIANRKPAERLAALLAAARQQPGPREADIALARQTIAENPNDIPALMVLALDLEQRGLHKEAAREHEHILKLNPLFAPAMRELAILLSEHLGDDEKAEQLALKARQILTEDAELEYELGVISYRKAAYAEAAKYLQQASRRRPKHANTWFMLGMAHFQLKNESEARGELQRALTLKLSPQEETEAKRVLETLNRGGGM